MYTKCTFLETARECWKLAQPSLTFSHILLMDFHNPLRLPHTHRTCTHWKTQLQTPSDASMKNTMPMLAKAAEWHWMFGTVVYQQKSPYWDTPWCGWLCGHGRPWWSPGSWSSPCWEHWPPSSAGRTPQAARRWWPPASDRLGPRQDCLCTGTEALPETRPDWSCFIIPVNTALISCNTKRAAGHR